MDSGWRIKSSRVFGSNGTGTTVGVGVGVGVGDAEGDGSGVGVTVGTGLMTVTPLFQTNFLPLLIHVYFLPADVEVAPTFEQVAPAFIEALATPVTSVKEINTARNLNLLLMMFFQF